MMRGFGLFFRKVSFVYFLDKKAKGKGRVKGACGFELVLIWSWGLTI